MTVLEEQKHYRCGVLIESNKAQHRKAVYGTACFKQRKASYPRRERLPFEDFCFHNLFPNESVTFPGLRIIHPLPQLHRGLRCRISSKQNECQTITKLHSLLDLLYYILVIIVLLLLSSRMRSPHRKMLKKFTLSRSK